MVVDVVDVVDVVVVVDEELAKECIRRLQGLSCRVDLLLVGAEIAGDQCLLGQRVVCVAVSMSLLTLAEMGPVGDVDPPPPFDEVPDSARPEDLAECLRQRGRHRHFLAVQDDDVFQQRVGRLGR